MLTSVGEDWEDFLGALTSRLDLTANLHSEILDFRGFDSSRILHHVKGWNSHVHRGFHINVESTNLSRDDPSREIGAYQG